MVNQRLKARSALGNWMTDRMNEAALIAAQIESAPKRRLVGESDWHPIMTTSLGPIVGRAKYELFEETRTWHIEGGKIIRHAPKTTVVQGSVRIKEEYYG